MCMMQDTKWTYWESFEFIVNWLHPAVISLNESFLITQLGCASIEEMMKSYTTTKPATFASNQINFIIPRVHPAKGHGEKSLHFLNQCVPLLCVRIDDRLRFADRMLKGKWWKTFSILELHAGSPDGAFSEHTRMFSIAHIICILTHHRKLWNVVL